MKMEKKNEKKLEEELKWKNKVRKWVKKICKKKWNRGKRWSLLCNGKKWPFLPVINQLGISAEKTS